MMVGALLVAAALLVVASGLAKLRRPLPTATMFVTLAPTAVRRSRLLVPAARTAGSVEVIVGALVLAVGGVVPAVLLSACYLAFAVVAVGLLRGDSKVDCGCFGGSGAPVGVGHVVLDVAGAAVGVAGAIVAPGLVGGLFEHSGLVTVTGIAQAALLAWLGYLCITALPSLVAARRLVESA